MFKNKRGQGEQIWIIIAIILGVLALVIMAVGFTSGWSNLWAKFNMFGGGKSTIASAAEACTVNACGKQEAGQTYFCQNAMDVKGLTEAQVTSIVSGFDKTKVTSAGIPLDSKVLTKSVYNKITVKTSGSLYDISGATCNDLGSLINLDADCVSLYSC